MFAVPFRVLMFVAALLTGVITSISVFAQDAGGDASQVSAVEKYDRLDGTGESGKRVDVVEWEGNLEVHIYPKGSNKGLSAKLDDRTEGKKVMVIGYRFAAGQKPLIRRAILGVPFNAKLKAFVDPTEKEFDKLALSNQDLPKPWVPYKLDPAPKQWYPDGDERNFEDDAAPAVKPKLTEKTAPRTAPTAAAVRAPASDTSAESQQDGDGTIKNFSW